MSLVKNGIRTCGKYTLNTSYFKNGIVSINHAWIFGFYCSDGAMFTNNGKARALTWKIKYSDYHILNGIRIELESSNNIQFCVDKLIYPMVCCTFYSVELAADVVNLLNFDFKRSMIYQHFII